MFFESHAHYDDSRFDADRDSLLSDILPQSGISTVINSGCDMKSSRAGIAMAEKYPYFYAAVGVHPHEVKHMTAQMLQQLRQLTQHKKVVALGEIGLDFYYDNSPRDLQREWFKKQLTLALEVNIPVIIHSRDAAQECFDIIKQSGMRKGVIHCFSGSAQMALDYVNMGYYIGIGGVITYKNAKKLIEVVEAVPLDKLLIETDCPYLAPLPHRGKRNDSRNLYFVVEKIAQIKQLSSEEIISITNENGNKLFFQ